MFFFAIWKLSRNSLSKPMIFRTIWKACYYIIVITQNKSSRVIEAEMRWA